ncbi:MAG: DUF2961 domain-containing protein [Planctomycetes bacterium]|nr:DUF2961 domain-containing protein [Planctomycetota bacterium]
MRTATLTAKAMLTVTVMAGVAGLCQAQTAPGYGDYTAWQHWSRIQPGARAGLASSYDRAGANADFSQYDDPPGLQTEPIPATVRTISGPGVIYRFWMPHLTAKQSFVVRMFFDEETTPRIDTNSVALLGGSFGYFSAPFVTTCAGGQVCYEPIPFAQSLRIETVNQQLPTDGSWSAKRHYYQYTYVTLPPGTDVSSYTGTLTPEQQAARDAAATVFSNAGQHPAGTSPTAVRIDTTAATVPAGDSITLACLAGPGVIRRLNVRMETATDEQLDNLRLLVLYDDAAEPAVDASVACFFGAGRSRAPYRSIPLGTDSPDGFYCYWPMPFHQSVSVILSNTGADAIPVDSAVVEYEAGSFDPALGYLHAQTNSTVRQSGQIYHPILSANGCGHYVGNLLYIRESRNAFSMLEGDEVITIDGVTTCYGTGTEDAYNGGYYYNWVAVQSDEPEGTYPPSAIRPLHGILHVHRDATPIARADQYRWHIADRVPFCQSIQVDIECRYALVGAEYTSVAFWYQLPSVPGNLDNDCDVDQDDLSMFETCASGPGIPHAGGEACQLADFDDDSDVDQFDFSVFQRCYSGANVAGNPDCAN